MAIPANRAVDYLTLLATRSLVFFPHDQPFSSPSSPDPSSSSPQSTPEAQRHHMLPPDPVTIPLQSLAWADRECAIFLLNHLLANALPSYEPNPAFSASPGTVSAMEKRIAAEVEGLVWKEVEKGKQFIRAIGEWYGTSRGGMSDETLKALAKGCGVSIKDDDEMEHHKESGAVHSHTVQEVLLA